MNKNNNAMRHTHIQAILHFSKEGGNQFYIKHDKYNAIIWYI